MKRLHLVVPLLLAGLCAFVLSQVAYAADARYLVVAPHTKEECLKALDETSEKGEAFLSKFNWGCNVGDHTGYAIIDAKDEAAVKKMLPTSMASKAKVTKVAPFTQDQIKSFHEKMK